MPYLPLESEPLFVPGRLCLFGEHSDWASEHGLHEGACLVIGTDQGLSAVARPAQDFVVNSLVPDRLGRPSGRRREMRCAWDARTLLEAARDRDEFFRYCAGVACEVRNTYGVGGLELRIRAMDLPLRKGVSSSAAVCILVAQAFDRVYRLGLSRRQMMELAYRGERCTGSQCGRMDQACVYGKTPVMLHFRHADELHVEPMDTRGELFLFFVDLAGEKDTVRILHDLQAAYRASRNLQRALGEENLRLVARAREALRLGQAETLGALMTEAQALFDAHVAPHSPEQLASPRLHAVLDCPALREHVLGGKGVGSQGDGTAQFVARSEADRQAAIEALLTRFPDMRAFPLTIVPQSAAAPERPIHALPHPPSLWTPRRLSQR